MLAHDLETDWLLSTTPLEVDVKFSAFETATLEGPEIAIVALEVCGGVRENNLPSPSFNLSRFLAAGGVFDMSM